MSSLLVSSECKTKKSAYSRPLSIDVERWRKWVNRWCQQHSCHFVQKEETGQTCRQSRTAGTRRPRSQEDQTHPSSLLCGRSGSTASSLSIHCIRHQPVPWSQERSHRSQEGGSSSQGGVRRQYGRRAEIDGAIVLLPDVPSSSHCLPLISSCANTRLYDRICYNPPLLASLVRVSPIDSDKRALPLPLMPCFAQIGSSKRSSFDGKEGDRRFARVSTRETRFRMRQDGVDHETPKGPLARLRRAAVARSTFVPLHSLSSPQ